MAASSHDERAIALLLYYGASTELHDSDHVIYSSLSRLYFHLFLTSFVSKKICIL